MSARREVAAREATVQQQPIAWSRGIAREQPIPQERAETRDELDYMQSDPWLDVEKKLVGWSLGLGVILLVVLIWLSYTFFPAH
jgi:hypothetical protein